MPQIHDNHTYNENGAVAVCGKHWLVDWAKSGHDAGTAIGKWPTDQSNADAGMCVVTSTEGR